jgi:hypothetical protein
MDICQRCDAELDPGDSFCKTCGCELETGLYCMACGVEIESEVEWGEEGLCRSCAEELVGLP